MPWGKKTGTPGTAKPIIIPFEPPFRGINTRAIGKFNGEWRHLVNARPVGNALRKRMGTRTAPYFPEYCLMLPQNPYGTGISKNRDIPGRIVKHCSLIDPKTGAQFLALIWSTSDPLYDGIVWVYFTLTGVGHVLIESSPTDKLVPQVSYSYQKFYLCTGYGRVHVKDFGVPNSGIVEVEGKNHLDLDDETANSIIGTLPRPACFFINNKGVPVFAGINSPDTNLYKCAQPMRAPSGAKVLTSKQPGIGGLPGDTYRFAVTGVLEPQGGIEPETTAAGTPIHRIEMDVRGRGYSEALVEIVGDGTGAQAQAIIDSRTGCIWRIIVNAGGAGYTAPQVVIDGDGEGAEATATVVAGVITKITMVNQGHSYSWADASITDPFGAGVALQTDIDLGEISAIVLTAKGDDYTYATINIIGNGLGAAAHATTGLEATLLGILSPIPAEAEKNAVKVSWLERLGVKKYRVYETTTNSYFDVVGETSFIYFGQTATGSGSPPSTSSAGNGFTQFTQDYENCVFFLEKQSMQKPDLCMRLDNFMPIPRTEAPDMNDRIIFALDAFGGTVVFRKRSIWYITGTQPRLGPTYCKATRIASGIGTESPNTVKMCSDGYIYFLDRKGPHRLKGSNPGDIEDLTYGIVDYFRETGIMGSSPLVLNPLNLPYAHAVNDEANKLYKLWLDLSVQTNGTRNEPVNICLVLNYGVTGAEDEKLTWVIDGKAGYYKSDGTINQTEHGFVFASADYIDDGTGVKRMFYGGFDGLSYIEDSNCYDAMMEFQAEGVNTGMIQVNTAEVQGLVEYNSLKGAYLEVVDDRTNAERAISGICGYEIVSGGTGYTAGGTITVAGDGAGGAATPIFTGGVLTSIVITNPGAGYTYATFTVVPIGPGGGATATALVGSVSFSGRCVNGSRYLIDDHRDIKYWAPSSAVGLVMGAGVVHSSDTTLFVIPPSSGKFVCNGPVVGNALFTKTFNPTFDHEDQQWMCFWFYCNQDVPAGSIQFQWFDAVGLIDTFDIPEIPKNTWVRLWKQNTTGAPFVVVTTFRAIYVSAINAGVFTFWMDDFEPMPNKSSQIKVATNFKNAAGADVTLQNEAWVKTYYPVAFRAVPPEMGKGDLNWLWDTLSAKVRLDGKQYVNFIYTSDPKYWAPERMLFEMSAPDGAIVLDERWPPYWTWATWWGNKETDVFQLGLSPPNRGPMFNMVIEEKSCQSFTLYNFRMLLRKDSTVMVNAG